MPLLFTVPAALVLIVVTIGMWRNDPRRLGIGVVGAAAGFFVLESVLTPLSLIFPTYLVYLIPLLLLPALIVILSAYLIGNGAKMLRAESVSLGNLLSLIAGVALLGVPVTTWLVVSFAFSAPGSMVVAEAFAVGFVGVVALGSTYIATFFVLFLAYGAVYRRAKQGPFDAIIVLGAGLVDGQVAPLLASRLDRAVELFRARRADGGDCVLIPSGGQGSDEPRSEGEAMAEYLEAAGVPPARILPETESVNTEENLTRSAVIAEWHRAGARALIVTSDYHVMRAAMLARRTGLPSGATGARTARYFVPSATLREFAAVAAMFPRTQVAAAASCVLLSLAAAGLYLVLRLV